MFRHKRPVSIPPAHAILPMLCLLLLANTAAKAQDGRLYEVFQEHDFTFGGSKADNLQDLIQTCSGGYFGVGETKSKSEGGRDLFLLLLDEQFTEVFKKPVGGNGNDGAYAAVQAFDGGFVVCGYSESKRKDHIGASDAFLLKADEKGATLWSKNFGSEGNDVFRDILQLPDGSFVVAGAKDERFWYARIDRNGQSILWEHTLALEQSTGTALTHTADGNIAMTGYREISRSRIRSAMLLLKISPSGELLFQQEYNADDGARGLDIVELQDLDLAILGSSFSSAYKDDMCLAVTNPAGQLRFALRPFGGTGDDRGLCLAQELDGSLILGGSTQSHVSHAQRPNLWLRKVDPATGDSKWSKKDELYMGYVQSDLANSVLIDNRGQLISAGLSNRPGQGDDAWLVHFDNKPAVGGIEPGQIQLEKPRLFEWDQNNEINPEERCYIGFELVNNSPAQLAGLYARVQQTSGFAGLQYLPKVQLPRVPASSRAFMALPVAGKENLEAGTNSFEVVLFDINDRRLGQFTLDIRTNKRPEPALQIAEARFVTTNNTPARRSDPISFAFTIKNNGNRIAENVELRFHIPGEVPLELATQKIGDLLPYQSQRAGFSFTVPGSYASDTVALFCSVVETESRYGDNGKYTLVLDEAVFVLPDSLKKKNSISALWVPEFSSLNGSVQHNKNITVKAILVSDKPVAVDQVVLLRNRNEPIPVAQTGRLVLLQSEDNIFVYKLYCPLALQRGPNAFSLQAANASGTARAKETPSIEYQAPESNLYVYSIGVPLAEEGLQYSVSDAGKFGSLLRQNKEGGYFKRVETSVITDPELTKYYKFRKILIDIRERAKLGQFKPEDLLLVYVSSQSTDKVKGALKIKASNYDGVEVETTAVDYEDFFMYFLDDPIITCRKMLILDVFSPKPIIAGQAEESEGEDPITLSNTLNTLQAQQKDLITLMACSPNENSYEDPSWGNSALIAAMGQLFSGNNLELADTNRDKELTLNEFYSFLRTRVPDLLKKSGTKKATPQTPFIPRFDARKSDFTIFAY